MIKYIFSLCLTFAITSVMFAQDSPIFIDGRFSDWENKTELVSDNLNDGASIDFKGFSISNDEDFLYIKVEFTEELKLTDGNQINLSIDADNNYSTGWLTNGIGSELDWNFGQRRGYYNIDNSSERISYPDISLRLLPTVTSKIFEIAISLKSKPNDEDFLFKQDTIKICFTDNVTGGDKIPDEGVAFTYVIKKTNFTEFTPKTLNKEDADLVRFMNYNIKADFNNNLGGLNDPSRTDYLTRIFSAISPEIIAINEAWDYTSVDEALQFINDTNPLQDGQTWYANKTDGSNITLSKFPILETWKIPSVNSMSANLIDLSSKNLDNVLVISAHLKCCNEAYDNQQRQRQADAFANFILDAKSPGGRITLPKNTPFVLMGDLNLVGDAQQLRTLITGDIQETAYYGSAAPLDWDGTELHDLISYQTENRMAYTWRNDYGSNVPGRLDFMIYSDVVMDVEKTFILQTELMSPESLHHWGLEETDTRRSSDHLPKVADFRLPDIVIDSTKQLTLTDFEASSIFHIDSVFDIKWNSNFIENIKIELIDNNNEIVKIISNNELAVSNLYEWNVPNTIDISKPYRITITEENNLLSDTSNFFYFNSAKDNLSVFPNPSSGIFYLDFKNSDYEKVIKVYDIVGKLVYEKQGSANYRQKIDLSKYKDGIYFIKVSMKRFTFVRKITLDRVE